LEEIADMQLRGIGQFLPTFAEFGMLGIEKFYEELLY
jgi:hypothetical protein